LPIGQEISVSREIEEQDLGTTQAWRIHGMIGRLFRQKSAQRELRPPILEALRAALLAAYRCCEPISLEIIALRSTFQTGS